MVLGNSYCNDSSAGVIIDFITDALAKDLKDRLDNANFFSILTDGSTDSSMIEKEAMFVITFDPTPPNSDKIKIQISHLDLANLVTADAR